MFSIQLVPDLSGTEMTMSPSRHAICLCMSRLIQGAPDVPGRRSRPSSFMNLPLSLTTLPQTTHSARSASAEWARFIGGQLGVTVAQRGPLTLVETRRILARPSEMWWEG
jgi:hypothetical protein